MLFRGFIMLVCLVAFVTGCNRLVSKFAGAHRLRSYAIEEIEFEGAGNAAYLEIRGGWQTGDFAYGAPPKAGRKGIIQYPVVGDAYLARREQGETVPVSVIVWRAEADPPCVRTGSCAEKQAVVVRGLVRDIPERGRDLEALIRQGYTLKENVVFIAAGIAPLSWYWYVLLMLGAVALAAGVEWRQLRRLMRG